VGVLLCEWCGDVGEVVFVEWLVDECFYGVGVVLAVHVYCCGDCCIWIYLGCDVGWVVEGVMDDELVVGWVCVIVVFYVEVVLVGEEVW